jgi:N-acetylmuramoyl-L-alanine amidase
MTEYGQDIIASAIYRGFREYKEDIERRSNFTAVTKEEPEQHETVAEITPEIAIPPDQMIFSVQVASSKNKIAPEPSSFKGHQGVMVMEDGRWFKYLIGTETDYHSALEFCQEIKVDFPDAFVVASKNGELVPLSEALLEINK